MVSGQASPTFVSIDEVLLLHALAILEFGGSAGTRDVGLLESAIAQPQMTFEGRMLHSTVMLDVAAGNLPKRDLANWIGDRVAARPSVELREFFGSLSFAELSDTLIAIAQSYKSGGPQELTAIVNEASTAMPVVGVLAHAYQFNRENNEQTIHYIQVLCALHRIAEEHGYEW